MRNPFKRKPKDKPQLPQTPLHMPLVSPAPDLSKGKMPSGQSLQPHKQPMPGAAPARRRQPQVATEQTMEFLKKVEPDDILELLFPRLVTDQKTRLEECTAELEQIDKELTRLQVMRDDVLNTQAQQSSGVTNF